MAGRTATAQYFVSFPNATSNDRRDALWHWFAANADGRGEYCYTGNSHVATAHRGTHAGECGAAHFLRLLF
jgi:hypothetical protein